MSDYFDLEENTKRINFVFDMENKDLISVIVPVWNAGSLLREALESLRRQSHINFEAILVNDGSTDDSEEICRLFCESDVRFILLNQQNSGVSAARNAGIEAASGEWVAFMDADDLMMPDALYYLFDVAEESGAQIIVGDYIRGKKCRSCDMSVSRNSKMIKYDILPSEAAIKVGLYQKRILNNPWGVLFHRSVFAGNPPLRFRKCRYEDLDLFYQAFDRVEKVCLLQEKVYFYRDVPGSFINSWSDARLDVLDVTDRMVEYFKGKNSELLKAASDRRFSAHFNMLLTMRRFGIDNPVQKRRCINVIKEQRRAELADPNVRLKNKLGALLSYILCIK